MTSSSEFYTLTLANGLRCVHRYSDSPVAHLSLTIGAGTRHESEEQHGVAHLTEHLLFKGTSNHKSYYINSALDSVGGELNAFTTKEETVLHATCALPYTKKGTELLCDMALNSLFDPKEIVKEKEVIIDEINSYKDSPSELIFDEFEEMLFAGSSLGRNILGDKKKLRKITKNDITEFVARNYNIDNMVFALSARMTHRDFERLCIKVFGEMVSVKKSCSVSPQVSYRREVFDTTLNRRVAQAHIVVGGYAPSIFDSDRVATALLINIVGGPSALSRMNLILRERHAITYNAEASYIPFSDTGVYTLYYSCDKGKVERAGDILDKELDSFTSVEMSSARLNRYKKQFIGQLLIANQSGEGAMIAVAKSMLQFGEVESTSSIVSKIEAISTQDMLRVARKLFTKENKNRLIYR